MPAACGAPLANSSAAPSRPAAALLVRCEEIERHVAPEVPLLRIELMNRHQLDRGDAEFLQVRNLVDDRGKAAAAIGGDAGVGALREAADVHFIDDEIVSVARPLVCLPVERKRGRGQRAERCAAVVRAGLDRGAAAERGRKKHAAHVRIEEQLVRSEAMAGSPIVRAVDAVGVVGSAGDVSGRHAAVPHAAAAVLQRIERPFGDRVHEIRGLVEQQRNGGCVPGVEREVPGLLRRHPAHAEWIRRAFDRPPRFHRRRERVEVDDVGWDGRHLGSWFGSPEGLRYEWQP